MENWMESPDKLLYYYCGQNGYRGKKQKITIQNIILISKLNIYEMRKMNNTFWVFHFCSTCFYH